MCVQTFILLWLQICFVHLIRGAAGQELEFWCLTPCSVLQLEQSWGQRDAAWGWGFLTAPRSHHLKAPAGSLRCYSHSCQQPEVLFLLLPAAWGAILACFWLKRLSMTKAEKTKMEGEQSNIYPMVWWLKYFFSKVGDVSPNCHRQGIRCTWIS